MSEESLAAAIEPKLVLLRRPAERGHWGVYVGSHGGEGKTLLKAMRACLMCCGLREWWRVDHGEGELLYDFLDRSTREHLGRPVYINALPAQVHQ